MSEKGLTATGRLERLRRWSGGSWGFPILVWLAQRLYLQVLGWIVVAAAGVPAHSRAGTFGTYFNWDSGWFSCIASSGYFGPPCADGATNARFAFFPLYPVTSGWVARLAGAGALTDAAVTFGLWLVAAIGSLVSVIALYRLAALDGDVARARRSTLLFAFGPYAVFLVASYSESIYLAFAIVAWYAGRQGRWWWCGAAGLLAGLSRASGIFLVPALFVLYLTQRRRAGLPLRIAHLIAVALSGVGIVAYWGWLALRTGDLQAWFHAQGEGWNRSTQWPWSTLLNQAVHVLREPRWDWQIQAILECFFALAIVVVVVLLLRRRAWADGTLVGLTGVSLMTSTSYLSLARNTVTLFPMPLLLGELLGRSRTAYRGVLLGSFVLMTFNAIQLALGHWAD